MFEVEEIHKQLKNTRHSKKESKMRKKQKHSDGVGVLVSIFLKHMAEIRKKKGLCLSNALGYGRKITFHMDPENREFPISRC